MQTLGGTTSTCVTCGKLLPARFELADGAVWMVKQCPDHGPQRARIWSDPKSWLELARYHRAGSVPLRFARDFVEGCPGSCGLCPQHEQHVCMPILEITDHCDMSCPVCLVKTSGSFQMDRPTVAGILDKLIASEGQVDVLNLSGGEPTTNPHLRQIVEECGSRSQILYTSISTNGRRLVRDEDLLRFLIERRIIISLQFDGEDPVASTTLRGQDLLSEKLRLIDRIGDLGGRLSLTFTLLRHINESALARSLRLLFERDNILSVMIQPTAYTGTGATLPRAPDPLTIPDVLHLMEGAGGGRVRSRDFAPLPCSHPACFALAFYLKTDDGGFLPIKQLVDADRYMDITQNRAIFGTDADSYEHIREALYDLWSGPVATTPDSQKAMKAVKRLLAAATCEGCYSPSSAVRAAEGSIKSVFIHHFMDRHNFDLSRVRKCCQVYPQADGTLVPACVYNCLRR